VKEKLATPKTIGQKINKMKNGDTLDDLGQFSITRK
jgi:hypothetical protein